MQVQNNKEEIPFAHYCARYRCFIPEEAAERCGVPFDTEKNEFEMILLGVKYWLSWPEYAIRAEREDAFALKSLPCQTFLLRFLLEGKRAGAQGRFVTFREMPWGEMYIGPYTGRCLTRAAFTFGTRVAQFRAACKKMGAAALKHGDAGYQFDLLGGYVMQIMVWKGDEEFAPTAQILYSENFADGFAAEDRVVAGDILISAIKQQM